MGGVGGVSVGGWRIFNSSLVFTVLFSFVMSASAHALTCEEVPAQPGTRAEPKEDQGGCEYDETSGGITVTLTYDASLTVDYLVGDDPAVPNPNSPGDPYEPGAYTCLHYYDTGGALLKEISHKENNGVRFNGNRLIFEYEHPEDIGCEEEEMVTVKFEMYNGNPYIEMNGFVVSHIGYTLNAGPDQQYQITLGTLTCDKITSGGGNTGNTGNTGNDGNGNTGNDGNGNGNGNGDGNGDGDDSEGDRQQRGEVVSYLDIPAPDSFQSGISVICGWVCEAERVDIVFNPGTNTEIIFQASYGTQRLDTEKDCGDINNGFGLLYNWNLLGDGVHTLAVLADGEEIERATFTVTTLGKEFVQGVTGETLVLDFPEEGTDVRLVWQQSLQNFMIAPPEGRSVLKPAKQPDPRKFLENPWPESFRSGISVISGWVCEAEEVTIEINGELWQADYGTARADTAVVCGDINNGFGLLFNWNELGDGTHTVRALADRIMFGQATFTVTTLGGRAFVREVMGETLALDFPEEGTDVRLVWQEETQNFMLAPWIQDLESLESQ